ncbi:MAG: D-sedoheptulose 7-phosphate isomerase [bacterium]|nr:D-sedoheptulose 7-phosphate isomerase [bacterium]
MKRPDSSSSDPAAAIRAALDDSAALLARVGREHAGTIARMADVLIESFRRGGRLLVCGNGGSAADAQHIAGELVGRFLRERSPLSCLSLTVDTSVLTAIGNDYGFEHAFDRQVRAHGREGDVLLSISTSGASPNVINAVLEARRIGMRTVALSGRDGGELARAAEVCLTIPADSSPRIQEAHGAVGHVLCAMVEEALFGGEGTPGAPPPPAP